MAITYTATPTIVGEFGGIKLGFVNIKLTATSAETITLSPMGWKKILSCVLGVKNHGSNEILYLVSNNETSIAVKASGATAGAEIELMLTGV